MSARQGRLRYRGHCGHHGFVRTSLCPRQADRDRQMIPITGEAAEAGKYHKQGAQLAAELLLLQ